MSESSLLFASMDFFRGAASSIDMGATLYTYNNLPTSADADKKAIAYDWIVVGDALREAMKIYEHT